MAFLLGFMNDLIWILPGIGLIWIITLCTYRLTLHPLAKYPGPLLGKLTTLYGAWHAYIGDMHLDIEILHQKYGTFVRYGPNALLVSGADGFYDIYGTGRPLRKSASYVMHGPGNLLGLRDRGEHARKKRIFGQGFSDAAIRGHELKVIEKINVFCEKMSEGASPESKGWSAVRDITPWCNYLTTDVISKVIFSTTWDLLTSTKNHAVVDASTTIVKFVGITHQSALFYKFPQLLALFIPKIASSQPQLGKYMRGMIAKRIEMEKDNPDIKDMFSIYKNATDPESSAGEKLTEEHLRFNSGQLIVAGSDTSAAAIAATLFYLSRDSKAYAKVAHEVRNTFSSLESIRAGPALNNCIYLRSSVNETLRMTPVATQPFWREPDAGGTSIAGEHIPSGVNVGASLYTLHHTEVVFPEPYKYNIERWIPRNDAREEIQRIKMMNRYFAPFLTGPRQCIAKNFAQMELLLTIANIFWRFDFQKVGRLGEGGKGLGRGRQRIGEFQFKSHFTSHIEGPMVRFRKREGP